MKVQWSILLLVALLLLVGCGEDKGGDTFTELRSENCEVHFIDVGKADAILVVADGEAMLVDAGYTVNAQQVVNYLKQQGVTKLKYVVLTHGDKDHTGGMAAVLSEFEVGQLLLSPKTENSEEYNAMKNVIEQKDISYSVPELGSVYNLGKGSFVVMAPGEAALAEDSDNDASLVLRYVYGERSFLFMGDALSTTEKELRESEYVLASDVLKVGHHGKDDASKKKFLQEVNPKYAVICCGVSVDSATPEGPDEDVLKRLDAFSVTTYRTDSNGTIVMFTDGSELTVTTEK